MKITSGRLQKDKETFYIKTFHVEPDYCFWGFEGFDRYAFHNLMEAAEAKTYKRCYESPWNQEYSEDNDPKLKLVRSFPSLESHRAICDRKYRINLNLLPERPPHERFYEDEKLTQDGLVFLNWPDVGPRQVNQIRTILETEPETKNLSPLGRWDWDLELSTLAVYRNEVCGWMVFCPQDENARNKTGINEEETTVHAWYVAKRFREKRLGIKLAAHMMRRIRQRYAWLSFFVAEYNDGAREFYLRYFRNAITDMLYRYMLTVKVNA